VQVSLIASHDLVSSYRTALYPIHDILPPLVPRSAFRNTLHWGVSRTIHYIRRERALLRWIERNACCDNIHFQEFSPWFSPHTFRSLRARGKRLFLTAHQIYAYGRYIPSIPEVLLRSTVHRLIRSQSRIAYRLCDALFVHTEDTQKQLAKWLGVGHPPIFVTPYGPPNSAGGTDAPISAEERIQRRRLLFFGANRRYKELPVLLRAMKRLADCTLTVAGPAEDQRYREQIRNLVEQLPHGRVELIDDRFIEGDEKARLFEQSSLVVLPYGSSVTGTSAVMHDALAYGLPVVATDVGSLGRSVRCWGVGRVVPPNDDAALAGAVREMLTPRHYTEASKAVGRVREGLSWNRAAEITIEVYRSVGRPVGAAVP
jgi:glycosyltransferase involved in cell wall biosynthesis